jgi:hypothetical protein
MPINEPILSLFVGKLSSSCLTLYRALNSAGLLTSARIQPLDLALEWTIGRDSRECTEPKAHTFSRRVFEGHRHFFPITIGNIRRGLGFSVSAEC